MLELQGKSALITGAGRGIGQAIALAYAREGANLSLAARSTSELEETARECRKAGSEVFITSTDVTDIDQVERLVESTVRRFSTIDILVNNAGIAGPLGPLEDNDLAVDIGSNTGVLLQAFKKKKLKIAGIDPAANICKIANKRGIPTVNSFFNSYAVN